MSYSSAVVFIIIMNRVYLKHGWKLCEQRIFTVFSVFSFCCYWGNSRKHFLKFCISSRMIWSFWLFWSFYWKKTKNNHIPGLLVTTKFYYNRLLGVLFQSVFISCSCSHPAVGKVGEALLHQDGFQHIRIHHSQHGFPELIHTEHLHRTHLHFGRYLSWKIFLIAEGTLAPVVLTKTKK